jgi:hypothetical protein
MSGTSRVEDTAQRKLRIYKCRLLNIVKVLKYGRL